MRKIKETMPLSRNGISDGFIDQFLRMFGYHDDDKDAQEIKVTLEVTKWKEPNSCK